MHPLTRPAALLFLAFAGGLHAQTTLVNWDQTWDYMHPMGVLPNRPVTNDADTDFATTWYLPTDTFLTQYDGPTFGGATATGVPGTAANATYDHGSGPGPLGYGTLEYWVTTPNPDPPAEFTTLGTTLTTPAATSRYTGYFRTTFTVPNDGLSYVKPEIRYILDDGGFIYLDGVPVLAVNMGAAADNYTTLAANTTRTESHTRYADLSALAGTVTGANSVVTPVIAGNATVLQRIPKLTPGVHTLAVSVHNQTVGSSDIALALQLRARAVTGEITGVNATPAVRKQNGTPAVFTDDTADVTVTVTGTGSLSAAGWKVTGPAGSSLLGKTGAYGVPQTLTGIPIAEFAGNGLALIIADAETPSDFSTLLKRPRPLGVNNIDGTVIAEYDPPAVAQWVLDETAATLTLANSGAGVDRIFTSSPIDLSGINGLVRFTAILQPIDTTTGAEASDTFTADLIVSDGVNPPSTISLISFYDANHNGVINGGVGAVDDEFNLTHATDGGYGTNNNFLLRAILPDNIVSAQLVLKGVNDSTSEKLVIKEITLDTPPPSLVLSAPSSVTRQENGPGAADDTITFQTAVTGVSAGTGYTVTVDGGASITPSAGTYSSTPGTFTISGLGLTGGAYTATFTSTADPSAKFTAAFFAHARYVIGQVNFSGTAVDLLTSPDSSPAPEWINDATLRTLDMTTGGTGDKIVESSVINLSTVGAVSFSAKFRAHDNSAGSNFEATDKFKAELLVDGVPLNLISAWDTGDGAPSTGANGAPDGYLNGFNGTDAANYLANAGRDEFNKKGEAVTVSIDNTFDLAATIPASANSVQLKIYGTGIATSEFFTVSDVLFSSAEVEVDTDGDGMPDSYEDANGLNKNNAADAAQDKDLDGQSNLSEYLAGTNPGDASSTLKITGSSLTGTTLSVRWASVAGRTYQLQISPDLASGWTNLGNAIPAAPEAGANAGTQATSATLPGPLPSRYFLRVIVR